MKPQRICWNCTNWTSTDPLDKCWCEARGVLIGWDDGDCEDFELNEDMGENVMDYCNHDR
jgi:hypothetical protein